MKLQFQKLLAIIIASASILYTNNAIPRKYQAAGETTDSVILVDADQLKEGIKLNSNLAFIKFIHHYKQKEVLD